MYTDHLTGKYLKKNFYKKYSNIIDETKNDKLLKKTSDNILEHDFVFINTDEIDDKKEKTESI